MMGNMLQDLRFGARLLTRQPVTLVMAVAALALGIGLVALMYCMINGLLLRGLPLPEGDRLVSTTIPAWASRDIAEQQTSFEGLVSFGAFHTGFRAQGATSRRSVCFATANFFEVLRAQPILGRAFLPNEDNAGAQPVALISYQMWQEEFQGNASVLGSTVWVNGNPKTVVGVMPAGFNFPINESVWVAAEVTQQLANRDRGFVFGRLSPGVSIGKARSELNALWTRAHAPRPKDERPLEPIRVGGYADAVTGALHGKSTVKMASFAAMLATLLVLFLACANVGLLTLGRAIKRRREFAVRSALGASRQRLVFQMLCENLVLSIGGAIGGTFTAAWIKNWLLAEMGSDTSIYRNYASWWEFDIDTNVLLFVAGLTFLTNLLASLWPALAATRQDVNEFLKDQAPGSTGFRLAGFQRFLIVSQVSVSVIVLVAAVALVEHGRRQSDVRLTFDSQAIYTAKVEVPVSTSTNLFFPELESTLDRFSGVEMAALSSHGINFGHGMTSIELEGGSDSRPEGYPRAAARVVTPSFFELLNLPLRQGRAFSAEDRAGMPLVAVVNTTFAEEFLPPGNAIGSRFRDRMGGRVLTVVGHVPDVIVYGDGRREPVYYVPLSQHPLRAVVLLLRGTGEAQGWRKPVIAEIAGLQPNLPPPALETVRQELDRVGAGKRHERLLLSVCGAASLFLATMGIFGLIALTVTQRTREIGIRLALGATKAEVILSVLGRAALQIALGLAVGLFLAIALVKALGSLLPATAAHPMVYVVVLGLLGIVSFSAAWIPAAQAGRVDPMEALRNE